ncbi:MAG: histidine phosphatase family protein [Candidatus Dormibacteraeota bacterium]|nr:histidine phosphatase family protein [Candidatus Dormibacteraeota bacterium]
MRSLQRAYLIGVEGVTEIWLVRHADVYDQLEVVSDPPLSPLGRTQADRLAQRLKSLKIDAVYSSPLRRALQTAAALRDRVATDPRLTEARASYPAGKVELQESPAAVIQRMQDAVEAAVATHPGGRIVMVTHGIAILTYLCDVLRLAPGTLRLFPDFTSISVVRVKGDRRMAGSLCDTAHLEPVP